jgi:hypothetical protein
LKKKNLEAPGPPPAEIRLYKEGCHLTGFTSWSAVRVPLSVSCYKEHYADGHFDQWAILTTHSGLSAPKVLSYYGKRTAIEERHRQLKCFYDLTQFRSRNFNAIAAQLVMVLLTYTLRQWQIWKWLGEKMADLTPELLLHALKLLQQWVVIYWQMSYVQLPVVTFTLEAMQLEGHARDKAIRKLNLLEQELFSPVLNSRPAM